MDSLSPLLPNEEDTKHPLQSRTLIFNAVVGILPFVCPRVYSFILHLPPESQLQVMSGFFAVANIILRFITSTKIQFSRAPK